MDQNRPKGREKHVTEGGSGVHRRGEGLGTGPVGSQDGYAGRKQQSGGGAGKRAAAAGGGGTIIIALLVLMMMKGCNTSSLGGGGCSAVQAANCRTIPNRQQSRSIRFRIRLRLTIPWHPAPATSARRSSATIRIPSR